MAGAADSELRVAQVERDELRRRLEDMTRLREENDRTIENYKTSLRKEGEQSTMLLSSVEDMRTELQIMTHRLTLATEEKEKQKIHVHELKKRVRAGLEAAPGGGAAERPPAAGNSRGGQYGTSGGVPGAGC